MKRERNNGCIHVDNITLNFLHDLDLNELYEVIMEVILCGVCHCKMSKPRAVCEGHDGLLSGLNGFAPNVWETRNHVGTNLYPTLSCLVDKTRLIFLDDGQDTHWAGMDPAGRNIDFVQSNPSSFSIPSTFLITFLKHL